MPRMPSELPESRKASLSELIARAKAAANQQQASRGELVPCRDPFTAELVTFPPMQREPALPQQSVSSFDRAKPGADCSAIEIRVSNPPMLYRRRQQTVEAISVEAACGYARADWNALPAWLSAAYDRGLILFFPDGVFLSGIGHIGLSDWLVRGDTSGAPLPYTAEAFHALYEPLPPFTTYRMKLFPA